MNRFIINGIAGALTLAGTVGFIVGISGLFVANAPRTKKNPERTQQILAISNTLGPASLICLLAGGPIIMLSGPRKKKKNSSEVLPFIPRKTNDEIAA